MLEERGTGGLALSPTGSRPSHLTLAQLLSPLQGASPGEFLSPTDSCCCFKWGQVVACDQFLRTANIYRGVELGTLKASGE